MGFAVYPTQVYLPLVINWSYHYTVPGIPFQVTRTALAGKRPVSRGKICANRPRRERVATCRASGQSSSVVKHITHKRIRLTATHTLIVWPLL